jgi:hypothetical protein
MDTVETIRANADDWLGALDAELEQGRARALATLDQFERALAELRESAAADGWLRGALHEGRFDRPIRTPLVGAAAPSSARVAANSQAFGAGDVIAWARELVEPPSGRQPAETPAVA